MDGDSCRSTVALGVPVADPLIGMVVTVVILRITWQSFITVRSDPGEPVEPVDGEHSHDHGHAHDH